MDFAFRSRPTAAAADDEENGRLRRFPDGLPSSQPHGHGDPHTSGVDGALLTRRHELLLELHKGFMHQDMILCELMETERAMGLSGAGGYNHNPLLTLPRSQDCCHRQTPSVPSWGAPLHQPCGCRSSKAVWVPPVYPHVEGSLHAPEQTRPGNDAERHQEGRSSGVRTHPFNSYFAPEQTRSGNDAERHQEGRSSGVRTHPFNSYFAPEQTRSFSYHFELCHSPSMQTPVAGKADIHQVRPSSGHQQGIVWEKIGVEDVHNMHPLQEIKNQSSEGRQAIDSVIEEYIKKPMQQRLQYKPVDQENAANNAQKSTEFNEPTPEGTSSGVKRKLLTAPSSPVKKQMSARQDVKEEVREKRWTCTLCQAKCTSASDYHNHLRGRRHRENEDARFYCTACDVQCNSMTMLESHRGGRRHRATLEESDSDSD